MPPQIVEWVKNEAWARKLLGISGQFAENIDRAQLYYASPWPLRFVALLLGFAALWFGFLYLRDGRRPRLWVKIPLLVLRLIAVAALIAMLFQPMLRLQHKENLRSSVIVLVDSSQSMGFQDPRLPGDRAARATRATGGNPRTMTRAQVVERAVTGAKANLIADLASKYNVRLYRFHSEPDPVTVPAGKKAREFRLSIPTNSAQGNSTQMGTALARALDDVAGQPVVGALVLSDGGNNLGDDPVGVAERAKGQGIPVSTVAVGDPTPTKDLTITELLADQVVRKDSTVAAFVGFSHRGYEGRPVSVTLRRGNQVIGTQSVKLGPAGQKATASFTYVPKQTGAFTYTATITTLPGEITAANNKRQYLQEVVGKKLKILYVDGEPRWEYRYLRNAIMRDTQIAFSAYLVSTGTENGGDGNVPVRAFPQDEKALFEYDIVIIGDVPRRHFSDGQLRALRRFVEDKGSSLILIAGEKHMPQEYRASPIQDVFPVVLPPVVERVETDEPASWQLTPAGRQDPLMRLDDDPQKSLQIWADLPGTFWAAGAERARPGATVLAVHPTRSNEYGPRVLVAVQKFGEGRCLMSMTDSTWRWRWRVGDRYFYRYWGQALRAMTPSEPPGGNRYAQVNVDRASYLLGDRVTVTARLLDSFYRPIKSDKVVATVKSATGVATQLPLLAVPGSPGVYTADFLGDRLGKFSVTVASPAAPAQRAASNFLVESIALERQQPEANETLLRRVAHASGGGFYGIDELNAWLRSLKPKDIVVRSQSEFELFDAPIFLLLFIVPMSIEWLVRKRTGLM